MDYKMSEIDYEDFINIKIIRVNYDGEPSHWALEVTDSDGEDMGMGTAPTFAGIYDMAYSIVRGGDRSSNWEINDWTEFDANKRD
jgi:hypothetical protein